MKFIKIRRLLGRLRWHVYCSAARELWAMPSWLHAERKVTDEDYANSAVTGRPFTVADKGRPVTALFA